MNWVYFWWAIFALFFVNLGFRIRKLPPDRRWKVAVREIVIILLCYGAMMGGLIFLEKQLIFVQSPADENWAEATAFKVEDVWLSVADGGEAIKCHGWWVPNGKATGTLLYCHGNAGNLSGRADLIQQWQILGMNVLIFDYPGYGRSGGEPSEASCQATARAAYDWLTKEKKIPAAEIILYGKSLGGAMAVELAATQPHMALVLYSAFTSIPDMAQKTLPFFPSRYLVRTKFDNEARLKEVRGPLFIGHGLNDGLVPFEHAERLFAAAAHAAPKKLSLYPGEVHGAPPAAFMTEVATFLKSLPAPTPVAP